MKFILIVIGLLLSGIIGSSAYAQTTWNPSDTSAGISFSNGNLTAAANGSGNQGVRATSSRSSGKRYFEVKVNNDNGNSLIAIGAATSTWILSTNPGAADSVSTSYANSGNLRADSGSTNISVSTYTSPNVIGIAIDITNHLIYWSLNGVYQNLANPALGIGGVDYITTSPVFPLMFSSNNVTTVTGDFGATAFAFTPPVGFLAWDASTGAGPLSLSLMGVGK